MTQEEKKHTKVTYRCSECKGTDVLIMSWVQPNDDRIVQRVGEECHGVYSWCDTCMKKRPVEWEEETLPKHRVELRHQQIIDHIRDAAEIGALGAMAGCTLHGRPVTVLVTCSEAGFLTNPEAISDSAFLRPVAVLLEEKDLTHLTNYDDEAPEAHDEG